ncbi:MAG TPA: indole-3-glycerol phosphate synthase TrpC [Bacteroidota bacterium]|nr:indole-3-glycerol phosphate synthase TrpC [Bacteroidota bacterium]
MSTKRLDEIIDYKKYEVDEAKKKLSFAEIVDMLCEAPLTLDFAEAIRSKSEAGEIACIAEVKKASPSKGVLTKDFVPARIAHEYKLGGATAMSVLTDRKFFKGDPLYISECKASGMMPVLRKDFIIDEYQVYESRLLGADAILLIMAVLTPAQVQTYLAAARDLGMAALVECHSKGEIDRAVDCGADIIGINNRDLQTFEVNLDTSLNLKNFIPNRCISVSESGIRNAHHVGTLREASFDAFLVGEQLIIQADRKKAVQDLLGTGPSSYMKKR